MKGTLVSTMVFILGLLFNSNAFPQSDNRLGIYLGPNISYRDLQTGHIRHHKIGLRYDLGIFYQRYFTQKFLAGTGLGFSRMGYNFPDYPDSLGIESIHFVFFRDFLEIPLLTGYTLVNTDRNKLQIDVWFINQLYIGQEVRIRKSDNQDLEERYEYKLSYDDFRDRDMDTYTISVLVGTTYERVVKNDYGFMLSPYFKYGLLSLDNIHDWSLGVKLGLKFRL